jgi:hypothetical protein
VRLDERLEVLAPHLLLALGEHDHVHRQRARPSQVRLERLHVQEELPLVVHRAARVDAPVAHGGLERGRVPQLERLGRLHVVVAVDEQRRRARRPAPLAEHDRVPGVSWTSASRPARAERVAQPLGAAARVGVVLGARAHARDAEEVEQLGAGGVGGGVEVGGERRVRHRAGGVGDHARAAAERPAKLGRGTGRAPGGPRAPHR